MDWMLMPLRRYADFSGRSRRIEFWMFLLFRWLVYVALTAITLAVVGGVGRLGELTSQAGQSTDAFLGSFLAIGAVFVIVWLLFIIPYSAVVVRRFRDQDKSGWLGLLIVPSLVPYIGWIFTIIIWVFMCIEGTRGENRYGPDPKGENIADVFA
jgi:uncharacterized membrane protein YhaH (DUF805 family)